MTNGAVAGEREEWRGKDERDQLRRWVKGEGEVKGIL